MDYKPDTSTTAKSTKKVSPTSKGRTPQNGDLELQNLKQTWQNICEGEEMEWVPEIIKSDSTLPRLRDHEDIDFQLYVTFNDEPKVVLQQLEVIGFLRDVLLANALGRFISSFTSLQIIKLSNCGLRTESIVLLGYYMKENQTVKELTLDSNPISGEDYTPVLSNNCNLEFLSLRMCEITCKGASLLAEEIKKETSGLVFINLNTNMIACEGAKALANSLKWNKKLYGISLAGNRIEEEGAKAFSQVLREFILDEEDLKMRNERLANKAKSIRDSVYDQKETYLKLLPPMPILPMMDELKKKTTAHSRVSMLKKRSKSSTGKRPASTRKPKPRKEASAQELDYNFEFSNLSLRPPTTAAVTVGAPADDEECQVSDCESLKEFDLFAEELNENYDLSDNEKEYQLDMLCHLSRKLESHSNPDRHPLISRVKEKVTDDEMIKLISYGNDHFGFLNLAYNLIPEKTLTCFIEMLKYQSDAGFVGREKGIKTLYLRGNLYPPSSALLGEIYLMTEKLRSLIIEK